MWRVKFYVKNWELSTEDCLLWANTNSVCSLKVGSLSLVGQLPDQFDSIVFEMKDSSE